MVFPRACLKIGYLLDSNTCIFIIKRKPTVVLKRFRQHLSEGVAISSVTLAELRYGADKSSRPTQNHAALDAFLAPVSVVDFDSSAASRYGRVRTDLEHVGTPIGPLDTMIAAHALSLDLTVVTNNISEFSRGPSLKVEDWTSV